MIIRQDHWQPAQIIHCEKSRLYTTAKYYRHSEIKNIQVTARSPVTMHNTEILLKALGTIAFNWNRESCMRKGGKELSWQEKLNRSRRKADVFKVTARDLQSNSGTGINKNNGRGVSCLRSVRECFTMQTTTAHRCMLEVSQGIACIDWVS